MKRTFVIILFAMVAIITASSCTSSRAFSSKGGCKGTQGFIGYGGH